jgi:hypothetical protein
VIAWDGCPEAILCFRPREAQTEAQNEAQNEVQDEDQRELLISGPGAIAWARTPPRTVDRQRHRSGDCWYAGMSELGDLAKTEYVAKRNAIDAELESLAPRSRSGPRRGTRRAGGHRALDMARFGFNDVVTSGPAAADKVDESHQAFAHLLSFGFQNLPKGSREVPAIVPYAIAGGIAGLVSDWVVDGRAHELPHLAPELCYIALAPFLGDPAARSTAEGLQAA